MRERGSLSFFSHLFVPSLLDFMLFRAPIFVSDQIDYDVYNLLTDAQRSRLCDWSLVLKRSTRDLLAEAKFMCEQVNEQSNEVYLFGMLPNCNLYGCMNPDGSTDT